MTFGGRIRSAASTILSLVALLLPIAGAFAAEEQVIVPVYTIRDGLPQNAVTAIRQDQHGFVWLGTQQGPARFDGYQFARPWGDTLPTLDSVAVTGIAETYREVAPEAFESATEFSPGDQPNDGDGTQTWAGRPPWTTVLSGSVVWFATSRGLFAWNQSLGVGISADGYPQLAQLSERDVTALAPGPDGSLLVGVSGEGVFQVGQSGVRRILRLPHVTALAWNDGITLVGTDQGLLLRFYGGAQWRRLLDGETVRAIESIGSGVYLCGTDLGSYEVRVVADKNRLSVKPFFDLADVSTISGDPFSNIWVGSESGGLYCVHKSDRSDTSIVAIDRERGTPISSFVTATMVDRQHVLWVGTLGGGVYTIDLHKVAFRYLGESRPRVSGLDSPIVTAIFEDPDGAAWVGTFGGGLKRFDPATGSVSTFRADQAQPGALTDDRVMALHRTGPGELWVGTKGGGLLRYDGERFHSVPVSHAQVYTIAQYPTDGSDYYSFYDPATAISDAYAPTQAVTLWVATLGGGVNRYDLGTGEHRIIDATLPSLEIRTLSVLHSGEVWLGTVDAGVVRLRQDGSVIRHYPHEPNREYGLKGPHVLCITETAEGTVWVGTASAGVHVYRPGQDDFVNVTDTLGLPSRTVYSIVEDRLGRLWFSTNSGLAVHDPLKNRTDLFDRGDGLQEDEFNSGAYERGRSGRLYFGGINGLTYFDPTKVSRNPVPIVPVVSSIEVDDVPYRSSPEIDSTLFRSGSFSDTDLVRVQPGRKVVTFNFTAIHYSNPPTNTIRFRLVGFDSDWREGRTHHSATYTNLTPGTYTFEVTARTDDGAFATNPAELQLQILPFFYQSWWFRTLAALAVIVLVLALVYFRSWQVHRRNVFLAARVERRTAELQEALTRERNMRRSLAEQNKMNAVISLIGRLSHNLNTPLGTGVTATSHLGSLLRERPIDDRTRGLAMEVTELAQNSLKQAVDLVGQLQQATRLEPLAELQPQDLNYVVEAHMHSRWKRDLASVGVALQIEQPEHGEQLVYAGVGAIEQILDGLTDNVLRHAFKADAQTDRRVVISTEMTDGEMVLRFRDTGVGLPGPVVERAFEPFPHYGRDAGSVASKDGRSDGLHGVGLFIIYNLVRQQLNGVIRYEDADPGAAFEIRVPVIE